MSQFIRAIEIDQTPNKLLYQYGSELAEQANKAAIRQQQIDKLKAEQEKDISDLYGGYEKFSIDMTKELPTKMRDAALNEMLTSLSSALAKSGGNSLLFRQMLQDPIKSLSARVSNGKAIAAAAEEYASANPLINKNAVVGFANNYLVSNKDGLSVEKFNEFLQKEINEKPHVYINALKTEEALEKRLDEKGVEFKRGETFDPTGTRKLSGAIDTQKKDWENIGKFKLKNGIEVELPKINMEKVSGPFGTSSVITGEVYNRIVNNPALELKMVQDAKKLVHKINSAIGVNTSAMTREQFDAARYQFPELVDPFNDGVISVYKRKVLTDRLKSNYDENGFSLAGQRQVGLDVSKPASGSGGGSGSGENKDTSYIDAYKEINQLASQKKKGWGAPMSELSLGTQNVVLDIAGNTLGVQNVNQADIYVKKEDDGTIGVYTSREIKNTDGEVVRPFDDKNAYKNKIGTLTNTDANVKASAPLGAKSKKAAADAANQPTKTITQDAFRKMSIPERQKFLSSGGKVQ